MPRPRSACTHCAAIKSACSKTKPCSRCTRLSLPCSFEDALPPRGLSIRQSPTITSTRARHYNSSSGCASCLARRKKCDEVFPVCGDCRRLGLVCSERLSSTTPISSLAETDGLPGSSFQNAQSSPGIPDGDIELHASPPDTRILFTKEYLEWVALLDENHASYLTRRGHLNNSSALMYRNPLLGSPFPAQVDPILQNFPQVDGKATSEWHATEQHLLNHFLQVVSRALVVVNDDRNPFLHEILPMALVNLSVRHALLSLTAQHLCRVYPVFEDTLFNQKTLALHHLKEEVQAQETTIYALAATLLSCLSEICQGTSRKWILHLYGAKALIELMSNDTTSATFLVHLYEHLCSMAIITSDKVPLVLEKPSNSLPVQNLYSAPKTEIPPLFGLAVDLYGYLRSINQLAIQRSSRFTSLEHESAFTTQAQAIETYIQQWSAPVINDDNWVLREAVSAAQAVRWGCFIWLQHVWHGVSTPREKKQEALNNILSSVSRIRPGSTFDVQLLFPLFMAGLTATWKSERLRIEYRLNVLEGTIGSGNIAGAHRLLDTVWKQMNEGNQTVEWELLLQNEYSGIVLQ